jgi:hypothetical protein
MYAFPTEKEQYKSDRYSIYKTDNMKVSSINYFLTSDYVISPVLSQFWLGATLTFQILEWWFFIFQHNAITCMFITWYSTGHDCKEHIQLATSAAAVQMAYTLAGILLHIHVTIEFWTQC